MSLFSKIPLFRYKKVHNLASMILRGNRLGVRSSSITGKHYLDVGCGYDVNKKVINLDRIWHPDVDICWDITKGIPLPDKSLKGIFTEHCLEHITLEETDFMMSRFVRLLKPGGTLRVIVPNIQIYIETYIERQKGNKNKQFPYEDQDIYDGFYTPIISLNRIFHKWEHKFLYDYQTMEELMKRNGFVNIKQENFMSGRDPELLLDKEWHAIESLYVESSAPN